MSTEVIYIAERVGPVFRGLVIDRLHPGGASPHRDVRECRDREVSRRVDVAGKAGAARAAGGGMTPSLQSNRERVETLLAVHGREPHIGRTLTQRLSPTEKQALLSHLNAQNAILRYEENRRDEQHAALVTDAFLAQASRDERSKPAPKMPTWSDLIAVFAADMASGLAVILVMGFVGVLGAPAAAHLMRLILELLA